jgi:hypothetical protein
MSEIFWKLHYAGLNHAALLGEETARNYEFNQPPVSPFAIMDQESELIHYDGDDFGDCFDGRIKYVGPRFLITYNTRYNRWKHSGIHHTKILFALGHELGHFYLPKHREYLVRTRRGHDSFSEFTVDHKVEQQADFFASGLLMPKYLLGSHVNCENFVERKRFHKVRALFEVSLTGLLVRWTQLSDFPCITVSMKNGKIQYGWVSKALVQRGAYALRKGLSVTSKGAAAFLRADPKCGTYREDSGEGVLSDWIDFHDRYFYCQEHYFAIPHSNTCWMLAVIDEGDLESLDRFDSD